MISLFDGGNINRVKLQYGRCSGRPKRTNQKFSCDICKEDDCWESETEVYIHKLKKHPSKVKKRCTVTDNPICRVCLRVCSTKKELHSHIKTTHLLSSKFARRVEREIFVCDECDEIFFNKELIVIHIAKRHKIASKNALYECPKCNKLIGMQQVWVHFNCFHEAQSLWRCQLCLTKCDSPEGLLQHMDIHQKYLSCDICQTKVRNCQIFATHSLKHARDAQSVTCEVKDETVAGYFIPSNKGFGVRRDSISVFRGLALWGIKICVLCREVCSRKRMAEHVKSHMGHKAEERSTLSCNCGQEFDSRILLKQHLFKVQCDKVEVIAELPVEQEVVMEEHVEVYIVTSEGELGESGID